MKSITDLRAEMAELMLQRGIRTLDPAANELSSKSLGEINPTSYKRPYFTGYEYGRLYDWDQYFEGILQLYAGWDATYIRNSIIMFLENIAHDGHVPRALPYALFSYDMVKPFLAQQALLCVHADGDTEWISEEIYHHLKLYLRHWLFDHDVRKEGLSTWDNACHSGMDNHHERAGYLFDDYCEGVDLNSYLVRECEAFATLSELLGHHSEVSDFRKHAERRRAAINLWLWDDAEGIYYDYHARERHPIRVKHVGAFSTLWAKVALPSQADRLVMDHLLNPAEFWRAYPVPALSASEPGYVEGWLPGDVEGCCSWRAHTWMPTNYYTFHGLRYYGYADTAEQLAVKTSEMFMRNPFREYYAAESGAGFGLDPFWGWSGLALFMEEELEKDWDPTAIVKEEFVR